MPPRYNPFKPGSVVGPGMFAGRTNEIRVLERVLYQTKNGNPDHFLIQGERGIGKSSLLLFIESIAGGGVESFECGRFKFLTVNIELEQSNGYVDIIKKVGSELRRTVSSHQKTRERFKQTCEFLARWEVNVAGIGVKYNLPEAGQPQELLEELTFAFQRTENEIGSEFDGILVLIDEADKPSHSASLGEFVKVFTERLTKRSCLRVSIGLAGLPIVVDRLKRSHESSPRIFRMLSLEPLSTDERIEVVQKGLDEAAQKNGFRVSITSEAENIISTASEGYPQFIQQFAHSAFEADTDNEIDLLDCGTGFFGENGAFQQLGVKYFQDLYFAQIGSDEYREVLRAMSVHLDGWVSKKQLREAVMIKETTLTNAISALRKRNIIISKQGNAGLYRLPSKSFAVWIRGYTQNHSAPNLSAAAQSQEEQ